MVNVLPSAWGTTWQLGSSKNWARFLVESLFFPTRKTNCLKCPFGSKKLWGKAPGLFHLPPQGGEECDEVQSAAGDIEIVGVSHRVAWLNGYFTTSMAKVWVNMTNVWLLSNVGMVSSSEQRAYFVGLVLTAADWWSSFDHILEKSG